ncbi:MAG: UDP-3-O-(3-hydroxymyristoyl)glucosamine N-acyltransferase [Bacteroidetes bacterium]|nr:UDP-3-O-(3-hydroxymyristoyl)glucosamine N-acyltransferase [Bacteroidota bacterium]
MYSIKEIEACLGSKFILEGNTDIQNFAKVSAVSEADENALVWISPRKKNADEVISSTKARIIICPLNIEPREKLLKEKLFLKVENPKLVIIRVLEKLYAPKIKFEVHPSSVIHSEAQIHKNVYIGPFTYVGKAVIEEGTIIHGHCHVFDNVKIGKNVSINAGSIIGSEGFGYEVNENNEYEKFTHIGGVEIHDNVDIGANTCVVRGALANTIIGEGTKIDNLVHIGHNAIIGKHCIITANNMVGGSVRIEDHSWLGPSSSTLNQLTLSKNSYAGLASVITKNLPSNEIWVGNPARPIGDMKKLQNKIRELLSDE